jgi:hypothetical protein
VWATDGTSLPVVIANQGGNLAFGAKTVWIHAKDGVFRLADGSDSAELIYELPIGSLQRGDIVVLPDDKVLVAHADAHDQRLLLFDADGRLLWERSYANSVVGDVRLALVGGDPVVISMSNSSQIGQLDVYALDLLSAELNHLFTGGTRSPSPGSWVTPVSDTELLINIGGGPLALLDVQLATENAP